MSLFAGAPWVFVFALSIISGASLWAAEPSTLTPEKCLKALPPEKRARENYREYYAKFTDMICSGEVAKDKDWQSCVIQGMSNGRYSADNISDAYNQCNPVIHSCMAEMNGLAKPRTQHERAFYNNFCLTAHELSKTEKTCFANYVRRDPSYLLGAESLYVLCLNEAQECVQDFVSHGSFKKNRSFLDEIASICHRPMVDIDADWRGCMREFFESGRFIDKVSAVWLACDPAVRANKSCILNTLDEPRFAATMDGWNQRDMVDVARTLCSLGNAEARSCLLGKLAQKLAVSEAKEVCRFASSDTRSCLTDYFLARGDFSKPGLKPTHSRIPVAKALCRISNRVDRKCVIDTALERSRGGDVSDWLSGATMFCADASKEKNGCAKIVGDRLNGLGMVGDERRKEWAVGQICGLTNFEVRACALARASDWLRERSMLSEIIAACDTALVGYFFAPLDSVGAGKNCAFSRD